MKTFLGVDGGGTQTRFVLIDETGKVLASHLEGPAYYLEIGLDALRGMLTRGIGNTLRQGHVREEDLSQAFLGLPAYGEDSKLLPALDAAPAQALPHGRYRCDNDMVCGWAGALAGADGINIVSGTGSIGYGEFAGRNARAGGWGELFSDEGSSYWLAREGLRLFSRMSDGRTPRGALYEHVRRHFALGSDLDLCAAVYGQAIAQRSQLAQLSRLVIAAAADGDPATLGLLQSAVRELADIVDAVREQLRIPADVPISVSASGGMFQPGNGLSERLESELQRRCARYRFVAAALPPDVGAAIQAARLDGTRLGAESLAALAHATR
ncbi:MAG TPA: BadF/BadG/BcrA/BcrD ATPase family protein [Steroidobacteraceae bacterium]|jgi:N-acetylglucosamine kinase-like BadF-type ATPase|nr:BadF/BadG/BcrA/BcrD ATPase family protein [Steroidobacteraceae bacterium]